ncbi:MAG TPA: hypothetical protein VF681_01380 [Abditibacteriaceae bacterium]
MRKTCAPIEEAVPSKAPRGRPATGRSGAKSSVYASHAALALWNDCAAQTGKAKSEVFEEALRLYATKHKVKAGGDGEG